jgi:hypothetical protein
MADAASGAGDWLKSHWIWVVGGIAGVYVLYTYLGSSSTAATIVPAATVASPAASPTTASSPEALSLQYQYQLLQTQLADDAAATQAQTTLAQEQLNASIVASSAAAQTAYLGQEGTVAQNIGSAYAAAVTAQAQLPAATIAGADQVTAATLNAAGTVIASGLTAASGAIQGLGVGVGGVGQAAASTISAVTTANNTPQNTGLNVGVAAFGVSKLVAAL